MPSRSLEDDARLNKLDLANETEKQSMILQYYYEKLAQAKGARDKAVIALDLREAELNLEFRRNPPPDLKVTEAVIESLVATHSDIVELTQDLAEMKEELYLYEGAVETLRAKGEMLKLEVQLFNAGYYSAN